MQTKENSITQSKVVVHFVQNQETRLILLAACRVNSSEDNLFLQYERVQKPIQLFSKGRPPCLNQTFPFSVLLYHFHSLDWTFYVSLQHPEPSPEYMSGRAEQGHFGKETSLERQLTQGLSKM